MGDRATIRIEQRTHVVHYYTHWSGYRVKEILADGIIKAAAEGRLNDEFYAARIIFDTLTGCEGGATGYGIIAGDENIPGDLQYDSPSIRWGDWGERPTVTMWNPYSMLKPWAQEVDALEWAEEIRRVATA